MLLIFWFKSEGHTHSICCICVVLKVIHTDSPPLVVLKTHSWPACSPCPLQALCNSHNGQQNGGDAQLLSAAAGGTKIQGTEGSALIIHLAFTVAKKEASARQEGLAVVEYCLFS